MTNFNYSWICPPRVTQGETLYALLATDPIPADGLGVEDIKPANMRFWLDEAPEGFIATGPSVVAPNHVLYHGLGWSVAMFYVDPSVEPGTYRMTLRLQSNDTENRVVDRLVYFSVTVEEPAKALPKKPITSVPPIPKLAEWEDNMTKYYANRCDLTHFPGMGLGWESDDWYYDGARVRYQIADYTKDPKWTECGDGIEAWYADRVLSSGLMGHRVFPHGLAMHHKRTGDPKSLEAVRAIITNSAFGRSGGGPDPTGMRETAYMLETYTVLSELEVTNEGTWDLARTVNYSLGMLDIFSSDPSSYIKPFMMGLMFEALIGYYEYTVKKGEPDLRVPVAIQRAADAMWLATWKPESRGFLYETGRLISIFHKRETDTDGPAPDLNLLIAPAYAWLWHQTGDDKYREQADEMFAAGVELSWLAPNSPKQFNQQYRWSFDYVKWRTEQKEENPNMADVTLEITIDEDHPAKIVSMHPKTKNLKPAAIDGTPTWKALTPEVNVEPASDGKSALISAVEENTGEDKKVDVEVSADTDMGEGVVTKTEVVRVTVRGARAATLGLQVDEA